MSKKFPTEVKMIILQFKTTNSLSTTSSSWKTITNLRHRLNGKPAWQSWYQSGQRHYEFYYENNLRHRLNSKPARQYWYESGQKWSEAYYENDLRHRLNGKPASQIWHANGQKYCEKYYEHGEFIK